MTSEASQEGEVDHVTALPRHHRQLSSAAASSSCQAIERRNISRIGVNRNPGSPLTNPPTTFLIVTVIIILLMLSMGIAGNLNGVGGGKRIQRFMESHVSAYAPQQNDVNTHQDEERTSRRSGVKRSSSSSSSQSSPLSGPKQDATHRTLEEGRAIELIPHNLSIVLVKWYPQPAIRVSWSFDSTPKIHCEAFQVMYHPMNSKFRYIIEVPCHIRNVTIERLFPSTEYVLSVNVIPSPENGKAVPSLMPAVAAANPSSSSSSPTSKSSNKFLTKDSQQPITSGPNVIRFVSPQVEFSRANKWKSLIIRSDHNGGMVGGAGDGEIVKSGELAVVVFVLSGWIFMIVIFMRKWGRIRGIETVSTYNVPVNGAAVVAASAFTSQVSPTSATPGTMFAYPPAAGTSAFGMVGSNAGSILRSQRSKESDESSGSHDKGGGGMMHPSTSVKKKRLEDAIHQFMLIKNQQSIGQMRTGYGIYDQILTGRRGIRSMEGHRQSHHHNRKRRGSLEDRSKIRSESDLNQDVRMNRSAENLLRLDFS